MACKAELEIALGLVIQDPVGYKQIRSASKLQIPDGPAFSPDVFLNPPIDGIPDKDLMIISQDSFTVAYFQINDLGHLLDTLGQIVDPIIQFLAQADIELIFETFGEIVEPILYGRFATENGRKGASE